MAFLCGLDSDLPAPLAPLARRSMLGRLRRGSVTEAVEAGSASGQGPGATPSKTTTLNSAFSGLPI